MTEFSPTARPLSDGSFAVVLFHCPATALSLTSPCPLLHLSLTFLMPFP